MPRPLTLARCSVLIALIGCNVPPGGHAITLEPEAPTTIDDLRVLLAEPAVDENDDVLSYTYAWSRDGELQPDLTADTVPAAITSKGEAWSVAVSVSDGKLDSESVPTASVTVLNTPPTLELGLQADRVTTTEDLVAELSTNDVDDDAVDARVVWTVDGTPVSVDGLVVPADRTSKGQIWEVTVTTSDGEDPGEAASLSARIVNAPPVALGATVEPDEIDERSEVRCTSQGWQDADGDPEDYQISWSVNGVEQAAPGATLTGESFDRGDAVTCTLTPWDGDDEGEPVTSEPVTVGNAHPILRAARIEPGAPTTTEDLSIVLDEVDDPDGDSVDLEIRWYVDGRGVGTGAVLDASRTAKDRRVTAELIPTDGTDTGPIFTVGPVVINNTAPVVDSVRLSPSSVRTNDRLTAIVSGSDIDGDPLSWTYTWTVGSSTISGSSPTLDGRTHFDKNDRVRVSVTASDGTDTSPAVSSGVVTVANTAPTRPTVAISPSAPTADDRLRCVVTGASSDADRDALTYRATWTRSGSTYSSPSTTSFPGDTILASATTSGQVWSCTVTASDGTDTSPAASSSVTVKSWSGPRTFTHCGRTGNTGPSSSQCSSAYSGTTLDGEVTVSGGKQRWTVPTTGTYRIEAWGAQGASAMSGRVGGRGARVRGDFYLTKGTTLDILVGQAGTSDGCSGGGGGASFVSRGSSSVLLAAAGGGGTRTSVSQNGCDGRISRQAGTGSGSGSTWGCGAKSTSTIGAGGIVSSSSWGSGGGAWSNDGGYEYSSLNRGRAFTAGGAGGGSSTYSAYGGFGAGGAGNGSCGGGGGGGYSGGDGGRLAGGGGSYNAGGSQSSSAGARSGHGQVTIDLR